MTTRRFAIAALMAVAVADMALAQKPLTLPELQERMQAAERRIRELESNQHFQKPQATYPVLPQGPKKDPPPAKKPAIAARVEELEKSWKDLSEEFDKAKEDAKKAPSQRWTGRIHTDYWAFPGHDAGSNFFENGDVTEAPQDRFLFRRLRLGLQGDIFETMRYKIEFDFAEGNDLAIKDAYIGWKELPFLQTVRLGNQKRPYGLDHLNSSRFNVFMERPFVVEAFNSDARRYGVCSYGVSEDEAYNWRFGAYLSADIQDTGQYLAVDDPGKHHYQPEFAGRFANTLWYDETSGGRGYAHWAMSGAVALTDGTAGANSTARFRTRPEARTSSRWIDTGEVVGADAYELLGWESVVNVGALQCVGELMSVWMQRGFGGPDVHFYGGYVYVSYFLTGEHIPWQRRSGTLGRVQPHENFFLVRLCDGCHAKGWGAWQVAARYSYGDFSDGDILGGVGSAVTLGLNWWWTAYSRLQVNYTFGTIDQRFPQNIDSATGLPGGPMGPGEGDHRILSARFSVDF